MNNNPFQLRDVYHGNVIEVWLGEPGHPESELVLAIHKKYLPQLIAILRSAKGNGK